MSVNQRLVNKLTDNLFDGILQLKTRDECYEFFEDLCTINEIRDMSQRLEVARMLEAGESMIRSRRRRGQVLQQSQESKDALSTGLTDI